MISSHRRGTRFPKRVRDRRWPALARREANISETRRGERGGGVAGGGEGAKRSFRPYRAQTIYGFTARDSDIRFRGSSRRSNRHGVREARDALS